MAKRHFGIAHTFDEANMLTATGFAMGTPQYMPPEVGHLPALSTGAGDVNSLGIILHETVHRRCAV